jgi:hypothetical protein
VDGKKEIRLFFFLGDELKEAAFANLESHVFPRLDLNLRIYVFYPAAIEVHPSLPDKPLGLATRRNYFAIYQ